jgi:hypothetical protein
MYRGGVGHGNGKLAEQSARWLVERRDMDCQRCGWLVAGQGVELAEVHGAPVGSWEGPERPWVKVRPLTEAEALERESLGLQEEYLLESEGLGDPAIRVRRSYDLVAMAEYDFRRCIVDFCLAELQASGEVVMRRQGDSDEVGNCEFLGRMRPPLSDWVWQVVNTVNQRQAEQRAGLEQAKKN